MPKPLRSPVLEIRGLSVRRGSTEMVRNLDWTVARRQQWVILGPNGCGKTSLLRAITGYLSPTAGEIRVLGSTYGRTDWRELRRRIGWVSSSLVTQIPPAESARDTVISGRYAQVDLWAATTRADRAVADRLLRRLGIGNLGDRPWAHLSQGERQRVLIARALAAGPDLLILDEPCVGLDPVARARFLRGVDDLARRSRGPALVLVTHHVEEITPAFSHVLLMRRGAVHAAGPRDAVLTSRQLSAVFGAPLRLRRRGDGLRLESAARADR